MQLKSRQRARDHGEVYTHPREVKAMVDLVASQAENPEKTFLEPACGNGNFLAEILSRKLATVTQKHANAQSDWERTALIALGSLYGIELLPDNAAECHERLYQLFAEHYRAAFAHNLRPGCLDAARHILAHNILCADALSLKTAEGTPIVFAQWQAVNGGKIKRRDYVYPDLLNKASERELPLFSDLGEAAYIPAPVREYPAVHFLELSHG